jgi:hypothetical protein
MRLTLLSWSTQVLQLRAGASFKAKQTHGSDTKDEDSDLEDLIDDLM